MTEADAPTPPKRPHARVMLRVTAWAGAAVALVAALAVLALVFLNTAPGRGFLVRTIDAQAQANGLQIRIGRIDGSLYGRMQLHDVELRDPRGVFLTSPLVVVDWRPLPLVRNHLVLREVSSPLLTLIRPPALRPSPPKPNQPLLPDVDITLDRLDLGRIVAEPAVTGERRLASVRGAADIARGRAMVHLQALAPAEPGTGDGDRISIDLDAVPSANRLTLDARVDAAAGGLVAALTGLRRQLQANVSGSGDWSAWSGRASASIGGVPLADLTLGARSGRFSARGRVIAVELVNGGASRLVRPALAVDLSAAMTGRRRYDTRVHLASDALDLVAAGVVDLAANRFGDVRTEVRVLQPGAVVQGAAGRDVTARITLNGAFASPRVDYLVQAATLRVGSTGLEGLRAEGGFRVDPRRTVAPVRARVARVVGVPEAVGGVLGNLRADGDVVVTPDSVATDNLRFRSDRLDATLVFALSLGSGRYTAALKGAVDRYSLPGVGVFDLTTNARLVTGPDGQPRLAGEVRIVARRIENAAARDILGGQAVVHAAFARSPQGAIAISGLALTAPKLQITGGKGSLGADGGIAFSAFGRSETYGPVTLAVGGTLTKPTARLQLPQPKLPVPLSGVDISVAPASDGYRVRFAAASPHGPVSAEALVSTGSSGLIVTIDRAAAAGLTANGTVRATAAGPFAGALQIKGPGLGGTVTLSAAGAVQKIEAAVQAQEANLPLRPPLLIGRGSLQATALLQPGAPSVSGSATVARLRSGGFTFDSVEARFRYAVDRGEASVSARGGGETPFTVALQAAAANDAVTVSGQGTVKGRAIRLARPAEIRKAGGGWRLQPAVLEVGGGRIQLSGVFGDGLQVQARLRGIDLAIIESFAPSLGLEGQAAGDVDFALPRGGAAPSGRAQLQVKGLARTGVATDPRPVDLAVAANLGGGGARAEAVVRRQGSAIGRLDVRLGPIGAGVGAWTDRLMAAPISGGVRYDGPAEVLWALTGVTGHEVSGPVALGGDVSGRLSAPQITGIIRTRGVSYRNDAYGTVIDNISLESRFSGSRLDIARLAGRAGAGGSITGSGYVDLAAASGFPVDLRLRLNRAQLARSADLTVIGTGDITIANSKAEGARITGRLALDQARYRIVRKAGADVPELEGVRRRGDLLLPDAPLDTRPRPPGTWKLDIAVEGNNRLFVEGMGLDSEWRAALRVTGPLAQPLIAGQVNLVRGSFSFAGRRLTLTRGAIDFTGQSPVDPRLDIEADTSVGGVTATIVIGGRAQDPQISFTSVPALPQDEVLSRLLFGSATPQLSPTQALQLAAALNALRSGSGGLKPLGELRRAAGVDRLNILGADAAGGRGASLSAGKYITDKIYVEVVTDARGFTAVQLEIALSRALSLLSQVSSMGGSSLNLRYSKDY